MHQQQWMAALEEAGETFVSAPSDVGDDPEHFEHAYAFFGHGEEPMDPDARWLKGPSPDGKGEFRYVKAPRLGQEPELMKAPASAHAGLDATRTGSSGGGLIDKVKDAVTGD